MRLDIYIAEQYNYSRNKAKNFIEKGLVSIDGRLCTKPSREVSPSEQIMLSESRELSWVSRSAGKLEGFFGELGVGLLTSKKALDIGASTGGFTQILLAHDIAHVDAVDVGTLQLDDRLRRDSRVTSYENTDIRDFLPDSLYDIIVIDVSFISLTDIIPILERLSHDETDIYALYKPQFEVGRTNLRKTGVPKDEKIVARIMQQFEKFLSESGFLLKKVSKATVVGEAGNQEYMMHIVKNNE